MNEENNQNLKNTIIYNIKEKNENINILVKNITEEKDIFKYNETDTFVSASIIKIPIMMSILNEIANGTLKLNTIIKIQNEDILSDNKCLKKDILEYKIYDLIMWMITESCNSSTNILIKYLGFEKINKYCKEIGLNDTKLERYMFDEEAIKNGKNNYTSLNDMYRCFDLIVNKKILTSELCEVALDYLYNQKVNNQIPRYIKNVKFAHKTGGLDYLNSDVGIFELNEQTYFIGISVYNTPKKDGDRQVVGRLSKIIYNYLKNKN
jgi:beta-lactamase class A